MRFVRHLEDMNLKISLQALIGTNLVTDFVEKYTTMDTECEHQIKIDTDLMPKRVDLAEGRTVPIFRKSVAKVDQVYRKSEK